MRRIAFLALTFVCTACILSCDDNDEKQGMAADEQRSFLENLAVEFTQKIPATDFEELKAFADDIAYVFEDSTWALVGDTLMSDYYNCITYFEEEYVDSVTSPGEYIYCSDETTDIVLALSNFTGHFTAGERGWVYSDAEDLQLIFKDANEKECVLKIVKEGKEVKLSLPEEHEWEIRYDLNGSYESYESTKIVISVPEKILVSLAQDGKDIVKATYSLNLSDLAEDGYFDIGKTKLLMGVEFELNNGYKLSCNSEETPNNKLALNYKMSNKTGELISYTASADPSGVPSYVLESTYDLELLEDTLSNSEDLNVKNLYMSFSVLGKAEVIGRIADIRKFSELGDLLDQNEKDEAKYKKNLADMNSLLDLGMYYNGSSKKQAHLELEAKLVTETHGGKTEERWDAIPVMVFSDGARSSFEEFFDEKGFTKAVEAFEALEAQYDEMFD